jgi:hypothetical protein
LEKSIGCYVIGRRLDVSAAMYRTDRCDGHVSRWSSGKFLAFHILLDTDANLAIRSTFLQALRVRQPEQSMSTYTGQKLMSYPC